MDGNAGSGFGGGAERRFTLAEIVGLCLGLPLYLIGHARFLLPQFGEPDAARITVDAVDFYLNRAITPEETSYRLRTSPLYIHAMKKAMDLGVPIRDVPRLMSWVSLCASAVGLLASYLLFRRLTDRLTAALACGFLALCPAYFVGSHYGMASMPALAMLLLALLAFSSALDDERRGRRFWTLVLLAAALEGAALSLKADFVLTGLAFPGLVWLKKRPFLPFAIIGAAIVPVGLVVQLTYARALASPSPARTAESFAQFAEKWHAQFPFDRHAILDKWVFGSITHASGPFLCGVMALALLFHGIGRGRRDLGAWGAGAALPTVACFGFIFGNLARHNLSALPPLALLVASMVVTMTETRPRALALAATLGLINYFSETQGDPAGMGLLLPRSNLLALAEDQISSSNGMWRWAQSFARLNAPKKAVVAQFSRPFAAFEIAAESQGLDRIEFDGETYTIHRKDGEVRLAKALWGTNAAEAARIAATLRASGYVVWIQDRALR